MVNRSVRPTQAECTLIDGTTQCNYNQLMRFEWDEAKRESNILKHGIDFVDVKNVFEGETVTIIDDRFDYAEDRFITLGLLEGRIVVIVHTETDDVIRVISARKATKNEEVIYFKEIAD
jgi:uncharacterized protein